MFSIWDAYARQARLNKRIVDNIAGDGFYSKLVNMKGTTWFICNYPSNYQIKELEYKALMCKYLPEDKWRMDYKNLPEKFMIILCIKDIMGGYRGGLKHFIKIIINLLFN